MGRNTCAENDTCAETTNETSNKAPSINVFFMLTFSFLCLFAAKIVNCAKISCLINKKSLTRLCPASYVEVSVFIRCAKKVPVVRFMKLVGVLDVFIISRIDYIEFHKRQLIAVFIYRFPLPINKATFSISSMRFDVYFFFSKRKASLYYCVIIMKGIPKETGFFLERNGLLYKAA